MIDKMKDYKEISYILYDLLTFEDFPAMYSNECIYNAREQFETIYGELMAVSLLSDSKENAIENVQDRINEMLDYYKDSLELIKKIYLKTDKENAEERCNVSRICYIMLLALYGKLEALRNEL